MYGDITYHIIYVPFLCDGNLLHKEDPDEIGRYLLPQLCSINPGGKGVHKTTITFVNNEFPNYCNKSSFRK